MNQIQEIFDTCEKIYQDHDPLYEAMNLAATPVELGGKKPLVAGWTKHRTLTPSDGNQHEACRAWDVA